MSPIRPRVPDDRIRLLGTGPVRSEGAFVLYWMTTARRARWNFGLERAVEIARDLAKPVVVLEALRADYRYASDRFHRFVIDGMRANESAFEGAAVLYHPYVEPSRGSGKGLLAALALEACAVVTDDYPAFFLPAMLARASEVVRVRFEAVDSNGLLPVRQPGKAFARAYDFRRHLQRELESHLGRMPLRDPLSRVELPRLRSLPQPILRAWPRADAKRLAGSPAALAPLPIDHEVGPVDLQGGAAAGERALRRFVAGKLDAYAEARNDPDAEATSGLSPYLHFGHVSVHQVLERVASREGWSPSLVGQLDGGSQGAREGWWGMSAPAEAFLDQLVTWRELGFNACAHLPEPDRYASLPDWARATLAKHAPDPRPEVYDLERFERAETHDEIWNAAQNQLRRQGVIHNYLRMLWGKKILHWSRDPRVALATMLELNDKYAVDGRDPNSLSGIFWVLGRYDRAWGPERPVFGTVRYMSSDSARRKLNLDAYLRRWAGAESATRSPGSPAGTSRASRTR